MATIAKRREKPTWTKRDWTPIRRGDVYCSPACGGGATTCSVKAYEHAVDVANEAARDLGKGWRTRVDENLGWHAAVGSPCKRIWISLPTRPFEAGLPMPYTAFLGPPREHSGGKWAVHGRTPREAIENVLRAARYDLGLIEADLKGLEVPPKRLKAR